jgi:hypothetical protein
MKLETGWYTGCKVIGDLLAAGWSLAELSKLPEAEIPAVISKALERLAVASL